MKFFDIEKHKELHPYLETKTFKKNSIIYHIQDVPNKIGIILEGGANIETIDYLGNTTILNHIQQDEIFAESYALSHTPMAVYVIATQDSIIQFLDIKALDICPELQKKLLMVATQKNIMLSQRIFHTSNKSIRARVLSYLSYLSIQKDSLSFQIPFNRQQMADYLNVERSALSKELSKMKKEGLLDYNKNRFLLKKKEINHEY
jgi:CRP/FNR family transcriptional regulator, dissimilatory nitrate respiration regulator